MSSITQRIPNLLAGISQQPDNRKRPGQVKDAVNVYPDFTLGMLKRPGSKFVSNLHGANLTNSAKWFHILRDEQEKYIAQYADNVFRVWSLIDGGVRAVDMGDDTGVPVTCTLTDADADTYNNAVALVQTRLDTLREKEDDLAEATTGQNTTVTKLFSVSNTYTVDVEETLESGILQNTTGYLVKNNGTVVASHVTSLPSGYALGSERTDQYPLIASKGYRVFEAQLTVAATHTEQQLTAATTAYNTAKTEYDEAVTDADEAKSTYNGKVANCAITNVPTDAYLKNATADDLEFLTINDYTFVLNKAKTVSMTTDTSPSEVHDGFFYINVYDSNTHYSIILTYKDNDDVERTETFTTNTQNNSHDDIEDVVSYLAEQINIATAADTATQYYESNNADFTATAVGPGVYLKRFTDTLTVTNSATTHSDGQTHNKATTGGTGSGLIVNLLVAGGVVTKATIAQKGSGYTDGDVISVADSQFANTQLTYNVGTTTPEFSISVNGGTTANAIYGFTDSVPNTSFLPSQSVDGHVVKIINTTDVDIDDMYVKFETTATSDTTVAGAGVGSWVETIAPGLKYKFDPLTMPHQLVRQADGSFEYGPVTWIDRLVGDDNTNPLPTFVGQKISNLFFYRNRLGFLSNGNVIMSKAADYFNFFNTSAQVATDDDPIDISAVGTRPAFLTHVLPTAVGLVLYGTSEQHLLSTDSDLFSPKTVKVSTLSSYETDEKIGPVAVGTSQAFVSKTPLYTRLFELLDINRDRPPLMNDDTVVVPELVPETVDSMAASSALSLISLGTKGTNDLYQFRFLSASRDKRQLSTWYRWKTTTKMLHQFFDANTFYVIGNTDSEAVVESYDMSQSSEEGFLTIPTGEKTDVCLDLFYVNPHRKVERDLKIIDSRTIFSGGSGGSNNYNQTTLTSGNGTGLTLNYIIENGDVTRVWIHTDGTGYEAGDEIYLPGHPNLTVFRYEVISEKTVFYLPYSHLSGKTLAAVVIGDSNGALLYPNILDNDTFELTGDYLGTDIVIGYNYDMELTLPKLYVYQQDGESVRNDPESNLILHRLRVQTGLSGPVDYEIKITGLNDYTHTASVTMPYEYEIGEVNMKANATHVVPIHQRNENLKITIKGTTPFPVSLLGFDWEGKYNPRFYRRI